LLPAQNQKLGGEQVPEGKIRKAQEVALTRTGGGTLKNDDNEPGARAGEGTAFNLGIKGRPWLFEDKPLDKNQLGRAKKKKVGTARHKTAQKNKRNRKLQEIGDSKLAGKKTFVKKKNRAEPKGGVKTVNSLRNNLVTQRTKPRALRASTCRAVITRS